MEVHLTPLVIDWVVSPDFKCRRVGPPPTNLGVPSVGKLTISMAKCQGLALVILAKMEKWPTQLRGANASYDMRRQVEYGLNQPNEEWKNDGCGANKTTPRNL
jgi:hypothetical protein